MPLKHVSEGYNPFAMWWEPRATIQAAFEFPNVPLSIAIFVFPYLINLIMMLAVGVVINPGIVALNIIRELFVFGVIAYVLYLVASRGSREKNLLAKCFSALVLSRMIVVLLYLVMVVFLLLNPGVTPEVVAWLQNQQTAEETIAAISTIESLILDVSLWIFLAVLFFFSIWTVYAQFLAVKEAGPNRSIGWTVGVLIFLFIVAYVLNLVTQFALGYFVAPL